MKEDKKTVRKPNTTKKPNNTAKKPNNVANKNHKQQPKKNNNVNKHVSDEAPRVTKIESTVKERKDVAIDNDFIEEDNDKKLIVVIAIAILVIIATIVGLLFGCEKQEEEPEAPKDDEIVVPVEKEDEDEKEDVVVKVTTQKSDEDDKEEEEIVIPMYDVIYYYENAQRSHHESVEEGTEAKEYVPQGYSACRYYKDVDYSEEYTFDNVYEDTTVYLDCDTIEYTVVYNYDEQLVTDNTANETTFTVETEFELLAPTTNLIFVGWYLDNEFTTQVTSLNRNLVKYADAENKVYLYARLEEEVSVELFNTANESIYNETFNKEEAEGYTLPDVANMNVCATEGQKFLGWATTEGSKNVEYKNKAELELTKDYTLYAVCGSATVVYVSNGETVTVGYTNEELLEEGFDLPTPSEMGMETPTYFVPVDEETLTSKKVVSDDEVELGENEVYFSQVVDNAIEGYVPTIGDNVEGFEKEFLGWIEKTEEAAPEENPTEGTTPEEGTVPEEGTGSEETEVTEEEYDFITPEEVVEELTNSTEEEPSMELEAVWGIPEVEETPEEPTPEVNPTPDVEELPVA